MQEGRAMTTVGSYTYAEARDFIYQTFFQQWIDPSVGWPSVLTTIPYVALPAAPDPRAPVVIWDQEIPSDDPPISVVEAYVTVRHSDGVQASLRGEKGRRWQRTGV